MLRAARGRVKSLKIETCMKLDVSLLLLLVTGVPSQLLKRRMLFDRRKQLLYLRVPSLRISQLDTECFPRPLNFILL